MNLRYICCQPANTYYSWQVEVMLDNFNKMGINPEMIDIVSGYIGTPTPEWERLKTKGARFFFYPDTRLDLGYPPSIYFHLMEKHLKAHPELTNDALFTHDCDILFTRPPEFADLAYDTTWYMSDTNSYINYDYVVSKGEEQFLQMCSIVGISPDLVKANNLHAGGAQYIVKGTTPEFWSKVERDSMAIYSYLVPREAQWTGQGYAIQKWTAGMWAYLWNAYLIAPVQVTERMNFTWATSGIDTIQTFPIYHNAGVVDNKQKMFYKADYGLRNPYNDNLEIDQTKASFWYWSQLIETAKTTVL